MAIASPVRVPFPVRATLATLAVVATAGAPAALAGTVSSGGDEALIPEFACESLPSADSALRVDARRAEIGSHGYVEVVSPGLPGGRLDVPAAREVAFDAVSTRVRYLSDHGVALEVRLPAEPDPYRPDGAFAGVVVLALPGWDAPVSEALRCVPATLAR